MEFFQSRGVEPLQLGGCWKYSEKENGASVPNKIGRMYFWQATHNKIKQSLMTFSSHIFEVREGAKGLQIKRIFVSAMHFLLDRGVKDMDARGARNYYFHHISIESRNKISAKHLRGVVP
jgi:hypothetical protein